jgi:hypothetical protein
VSADNAHAGWKCPDCGRCYAPAVLECGTCNAFAANAQPSLPFPTWPSTTPLIDLPSTIIVGDTPPCPRFTGILGDTYSNTGRSCSVDNLFASTLVPADDLVYFQLTPGGFGALRQ